MPDFKFVRSLDGGNRVPALHKLPVTADTALEIGDLVSFVSGKLVKANGSVSAPVGVMAQPTASDVAAGTLVSVYVLAPNQVWRATASADASAVVNGARLFDVDVVAGSQVVTVADDANGCVGIVGTVGSVTAIEVVFTRSWWY